MQVLLIDNYDSFTYNVYQYLAEWVDEVVCVRNDELTLDQIAVMAPAAIIISPGPKAPKDAGISLAVVQRFAGHIPIFGVCLGHQVINEAFGGRTVPAKTLVHGKTSPVHSFKKGIMRDIGDFQATRYHSLAASAADLPDCLEVTCATADGEIMGLRHKTALVEGVQFHPEAIMTEHGHAMFAAFINQVKEARSC